MCLVSSVVVQHIQNSALNKQSPAVSMICRILTIEVDGKQWKVKGIKCVEYRLCLGSSILVQHVPG